MKFPSELESEWLIASAIGFTLDVFVYHTFSIFLKALLRFVVSISVGTDKSTLATGADRSMEAASCSFSGMYTY